VISGVYSITGQTVHFTFPQGVFFVVEPSVLITVCGAPTNVDVVLNYEVVGGASVFTSMDLTFDANAVGKKFSLLIISNDG
jgi:hypothetical protein